MNNLSMTEVANPKKPELQPIVFYCKKCKKIVEAKQKGKKLIFKCPLCGQDSIAIGTKKSIENFYHITDK